RPGIPSRIRRRAAGPGGGNARLAGGGGPGRAVQARPPAQGLRRPVWVPADHAGRRRRRAPPQGPRARGSRAPERGGADQAGPQRRRLFARQRARGTGERGERVISRSRPLASRSFLSRSKDGNVSPRADDRGGCRMIARSKTQFLLVVIALLGSGSLLRAGAAAADKTLMNQVLTIPMDGVEGRFDHFGADVEAKRLYVAALGNNTLEVIDLAAGNRIKSIAGLKKPTGVRVLPDSHGVVVASGDDGKVRVYD